MNEDKASFTRKYEFKEVHDQLENSRLMREIQACMETTAAEELKSTVSNIVDEHLTSWLKIEEQEKMTAYDIDHEDFKSVDRYVRTATKKKHPHDELHKHSLLQNWKKRLTAYTNEFADEIDRLDVYLNQMKKDDKLQLQKDQDKYLINFINITSGYLREVGVVSQEELLKERAHSKQIHPCKS